jgi:N-[(2S)-2-amino-2-carboxyethyl]-L-glutamate dehydrogenase
MRVRGSHSVDTMQVLTRGDIRSCLESINPVKVIEEALITHARGRCVLPAEAYLAWENSDAAYCRSLSMPGSIGEGANRIIGVKVINAAVSNPHRGLARAGGFTVLFDQETSRPNILAEGALISAVRTAAYTMASLRHIGPDSPEVAAMIGCGNLATVHAELLVRHVPSVRHLRLYDLRPEATAALSLVWTADRDRTVSVHDSVEETLIGAPVVITQTTSDKPYIPATWLHESAFIAHVSLDDLQPDAITTASAIYVDDMTLVEQNPRRILGALMRDGVVARCPDHRGGPAITGTLGDVVSGKVEAIRRQSGRVISNPFGMSILDLALLGRVVEIADRHELGVLLDLGVDVLAGGPVVRESGS